MTAKIRGQDNQSRAKIAGNRDRTAGRDQPWLDLDRTDRTSQLEQHYNKFRKNNYQQIISIVNFD
jgi:hypothetical protein